MAERIRWGILSTARIGTNRFIPGVATSSNGVVAAIASRAGARAEAVAAELVIPRAHHSYEALLEDPEVDAIYNPLPNSMHAEWTRRAARAGKPILCEKPLTVDAAEAAALAADCARQGVLLMEAFMYRFHPQHARVRALIDGGAIGELRAVRAAFTFAMRSLDPKNVRLQADLAGGALMDVGCYCVNASRLVFGEEPVAAVAMQQFRPEFGVDVALAGVLEFSGGRMATFDCGFQAAGKGSYMAVGSEGTIEVPFAFVPGTMDTLVIHTDAEGQRREERIPGVDQYTLEAEEFADCLLQRRPPRYPVADAVANMRAIDALYRSARANGQQQIV